MFTTLDTGCIELKGVVGPQVLVGVYNKGSFLVFILNVVGPQVLVGVYNFDTKRLKANLVL